MTTTRTTSAALLTALTLMAAPAFAQDHDHDHEHDHDHGGVSEEIRSGYFEDAQVQPRTLQDWQGDWQSIYPFLMDGTLDPVMAHKAESGKMSAEEYRDYYEIGYATGVERIVIDGDTVTFYEDGEPTEARYESDGYWILEYEAGNRGVRYSFEKAEGDEDAPQFIQFSDHLIWPMEAGHYHLYWGDDRAALLEEVTNWPTYFPADWSGEEVAEDLLAH
ncbi:metal-binding protein ZinT [Pseudoroseicyclus aestuarii]|uniref:Zinc transport system substrate-binding protein n=1 Tax=Pseudoroseicyclus aestuarii TaxID=1795041 RepID=A0A318TBU5_9RHOB|nr:metal-binding protein ZinT [Pseudoroseicyclus aestuarii]PYE85808.1 zinc transport system substrate-binding protein [Pseudoroseicyclus aestuarii]